MQVGDIPLLELDYIKPDKWKWIKGVNYTEPSLFYHIEADMKWLKFCRWQV